MTNNQFYNTLTSNLFAPYIIQPSRYASKSLIDNILIISIEYMSYSGNLTIQISYHLFNSLFWKEFLKKFCQRK